MLKAFPDGHFYSPTINVNELKQSEDKIWPDEPVILGIDFNDASHTQFLTKYIPEYLPVYDYPEKDGEISNIYDFYTQNTQFSWLDSRVHFVMLQVIKPSNLIEIGSGFSSLLSADVNRKILNNKINITCIEPYPRQFLLDGVPGIQQLIQEKVEDHTHSIYETLAQDDILFVDSSHVSKTGSDVNYIFFEILPKLKSGVIIHFHDICLPFEYKKEWIFEEGRSWNEQYLLRAFLMDNPNYEIIFGCMYAFYKYPSMLRKILDGRLYGGTSFWVRKLK